MRKTSVFLLLAMVGMLPACSLVPGGKSDEPAERRLSPTDFAAPGGAASARLVSPEEKAYANAMAEERPHGTSPAPAAGGPGAASAPPTTQPFAVDAMVGQVNGRPIYASKVFELIDEQLTAMGKQLPPERFYKQALPVVAQRLNQIVIEALILGEAERDLNEGEKGALDNLLVKKRQELIRFYGEGSEKVADVRLREARGKSLAQEMEDFRQTVLVRRYVDKTLGKKINVTRKDIERYYKRHYEDFNPKPGRTYHMIRTTDAAKANRIDQFLGEGRDFLDIAADTELNSYEPDKRGFFAAVQEGQAVSRDPAINKAAVDLKEGGHTARVPFGTSGFVWIYLKSISTGETRSLDDAQAEIEGKIRSQRYTMLTQQYHSDLLKRGSYDPLEDMADKLMDIAMNRYTVQAPR